jgi:hypothetical protein
MATRKPAPVVAVGSRQVAVRELQERRHLVEAAFFLQHFHQHLHHGAGLQIGHGRLEAGDRFVVPL